MEVFIDPEADHYSRGITHTSSTTVISRVTSLDSPAEK